MRLRTARLVKIVLYLRSTSAKDQRFTLWRGLTRGILYRKHRAQLTAGEITVVKTRIRQKVRDL